MAKAITNAAVPMGAVACSREVYDTVLANADTPIELFHGYTTSGHPLACAAGLATLDTFRDERLFERAAEALLGRRHTQPARLPARDRYPQSRLDRRGRA
jgi:adenosylmethionine-8-amino-7-oxononanoate aminotransferase